MSEFLGSMSCMFKRYHKGAKVMEESKLPLWKWRIPRSLWWLMWEWLHGFKKQGMRFCPPIPVLQVLQTLMKQPQDRFWRELVWLLQCLSSQTVKGCLIPALDKNVDAPGGDAKDNKAAGRVPNWNQWIGTHLYQTNTHRQWMGMPVFSRVLLLQFGMQQRGLLLSPSMAG